MCRGVGLKSQKWNIETGENETHTVEYSYSFFTGRSILRVDGDSFSVRGNPFKIKIARRELILVGEAQAILDIDKNGKATLILKDAQVVKV